jgi:hypothetical protein
VLHRVQALSRTHRSVTAPSIAGSSSAVLSSPNVLAGGAGCPSGVAGGGITEYSADVGEQGSIRGDLLDKVSEIAWQSYLQPQGSVLIAAMCGRVVAAPPFAVCHALAPPRI